jgi:tRNA pseudouridine55 synthase
MLFSIIRNFHGILLLDKPTGISSNKALQITKKIFFSKKAGHTGSLDPLATGLLPICFGEATKFSKYLLKSDKKYRVIAKLGEETSTADSDGYIKSVCKVNFKTSFYKSMLENFRGKIIQTPSIYSAIKYKGKPLYKYARAGISVPIKKRIVNIYKLKSLYRSNKIIELDIFCSSGTYVRSIIRDLGNLLKCGAHVVFLRRTKVSSYSINQSITIDELNFLKKKYFKSPQIFFEKIKNFIIPINSIVSYFPKIYISKKEYLLIKNGKSIKILLSFKSFLVRIMNKKEIFLGLGRIKKNYLFPHRLINLCV